MTGMKEGVTELFDAITGGRAAEAVAMIEANPALASAHNEQGVSALMMALYMRQASIADTIAAQRVDLDVFECAAVGDAGRLRALLGGDPGLARTLSPDGGTALHFAGFFGHDEAARILLQHDPDLEAIAPAFGGVRPIHSAAASGSAAIVRMLLEAGADPNTQQQAGWTALHSAAKHGNLEMIRALLEHGADREPLADDDSTPHDLARAAGHNAAADQLKPL